MGIYNLMGFSAKDDRILSKYDIIVYPYCYKYGSLPPMRFKICRLVSEYSKKSLLESNKMLEGSDPIVVIKNCDDYEMVIYITSLFRDLNIKTSINGKTFEEFRDEQIGSILDTKNEK